MSDSTESPLQAFLDGSWLTSLLGGGQGTDPFAAITQEVQAVSSALSAEQAALSAMIQSFETAVAQDLTQISTLFSQFEQPLLALINPGQSSKS